jgi:SAM-dependent methyltransferase
LSTHETSAKTPGNAYVLAGNATARDLFNRRTVHEDAALVVPHLRPGMRLVDFGCGAGSLTCGFASLVAPGEVFGFDVSEDAIDRAKALVEESGLTNVQFSVANIDDLDLPAETFDVAHFSGVLMYLKEPERALRLASRCLKSGGLLAAREAQKAGDWFGGPCAESVALLHKVAAEGIKAAGGDPFLGRRLLGLVREAGFERLEAMPGYSSALSDVTAGAVAMRSAFGQPNFRAIALECGISAEQLAQLADAISTWATSKDSVAALAERTVIGWKP